jgi:hypothetical protein
MKKPMKRGAFFMEPTEKTNMQEVVLNLYVWRNGTHFVERKNTMFSYQAIKNGNQIIIQKQQV